MVVRQAAPIICTHTSVYFQEHCLKSKPHKSKMLQNHQVQVSRKK